MAAIDIIKNMSNGELIDYYEYCMVKQFESLKRRGVINTYHPSFKHNSIYVSNNKLFNLHFTNEMFLLNEMWERYINSTSIIEQCWWQSKNIFQTKISYQSDIKPYEPETISAPEFRKKNVLIYNGEEFEFLASGTKRKTYLSPCKTYVIKVPREPYTLGILENKTEAEAYKNNPDSIYAKCELIDNDWLKMEYVKPMYFSKDDDYPDWTLNIAEHQVGYNLDDKLVAYDYGSEI